MSHKAVTQEILFEIIEEPEVGEEYEGGITVVSDKALQITSHQEIRQLVFSTEEDELWAYDYSIFLDTGGIPLPKHLEDVDAEEVYEVKQSSRTVVFYERV